MTTARCMSLIGFTIEQRQSTEHHLALQYNTCSVLSQLLVIGKGQTSRPLQSSEVSGSEKVTLETFKTWDMSVLWSTVVVK
jgi:hypothetical protein